MFALSTRTKFLCLASFFLLAACQMATTRQTWNTPAGASTQVVNGYPLTYRARGTGPTVVFVPGVLTDYRVWDQALTSWENQYHVVTISPRHFYPENWDGDGSDFTVRQHAKDLDAFIAAQGGPVYLVGWSYGAHIAYEATRARPDLVLKLILVEAPLDSLLASSDGSANSVRIARANETEKFFKANDVDGGLNYSIDAINGKGMWAALPETSRQMLRDNHWTVVGIGREDAVRVTCADFGALPMPVMLVQGELTTSRFHQLVAEQARCLPTAKVVTIPKGGHPSPLMNPSAFHDAATAFLRP